MRLKFFYTLLFIFATSEFTLYAQKEANHWFFGKSAEIDFSSGTALKGSGSNLNTIEGCSSISDANGNLLFFTNGQLVYDKNKNLMPNGTGLLGFRSSSQSSLIIPVTCSQYYIFQTDGLSYDPDPPSKFGMINDSIYSYSIVDMTLNGGLGDVLTKNVPLLKPVNEKQAAVLHKNGIDTWVVVHKYKTNSFYAYRVSSTGISAPIISSIGPYEIDPGGSCLKFSPNGKKLAFSYPQLGSLYVFDFDNSTGVVSNPLSLSSTSHGYGVSFSPASNLIYVSATNSISQFNLNAGSITAIQNSKVVITNGLSGLNYLYNIQNGPDGKTYVAYTSGSQPSYGDTVISVINNPNVAGLGCNFTHKSLHISTNGNAIACRYGLPQFVESYFDPNYRSPAPGTNPTPIILANGPLTFCTGDSVILDAGKGYQSYLWSNSATTSSITVNTAGTYSVTVTNLCGSGTSNQVSITVNSNPSGTISTAATCSNTGTATADITGGQSGYNYSWNTNPPQASQVATGLNAGNYTLVVTDANGCSITIPTTVPSSSGLNLTAPTITPITCAGALASAMANASGGTTGYTYSWSTQPSQTTQQATNLSAGTYWVKVTDAANCEIKQQIIITDKDSIVINSTIVDAFCATKGNIQLNISGGTPGYHYSWGTASTADSPTISGLSMGNYTVVVSDANNCSTSKTFNVNDFTGLQTSVNFKGDIYCKGATTGMADMFTYGGTEPYTYSWSNGSTTRSIGNVSAGTYTINVTDLQGCTTSKSVIITEPDTVRFKLNTSSINTSCGSSTGSVSVTVTGGWTPFTYSWQNQPNQTNTSISGLNIGTYTVSVKDNSGCSYTATAMVTQNNSFTVTANSTTIDCSISNVLGSASVTGGGGTSPYTYSWSNNQTDQTATGLIAGTYTVQVTDQSGCISSDTIDVLISNSLLINISATNPKCSLGSDGSALATSLTGTGPYTYSWISTLQTGQTLTGISSGTYTVQITDINLCTNTKTVFVDSAKAIGITSQTFPATCGSSNGSISVTTSGGTSPYTYSWTTLSQTNSNLTGISSGIYTLEVMDQNGCTKSNISTVTNTGGPNASLLSNNSPACFSGNDGSATVTANGNRPFTYTWTSSSGNLNQTDSTASGLASGIYTVTISDASNCISTISISITQPTLLQLNLSQTPETCSAQNGSIQANVSGGIANYSYSWQNNTATSSSISNLASGSYTLIVTDANSCSLSKTISVTQTNSFNVNVSADVTIILGESTTLTTSTGQSYLWSPPEGLSCTTCQSPIANPNATTMYYVTVTDMNGCIGSDSVLIIVEEKCFDDIYLPTAFSPNEDGVNDIYKVRGGGCLQDFSLKIYNRWGELVFETTDPAKGWNGHYSGAMENTAVFAYTLSGTSKLSGKQINKKGCVNLIR